MFGYYTQSDDTETPVVEQSDDVGVLFNKTPSPSTSDEGGSDP